MKNAGFESVETYLPSSGVGQRTCEYFETSWVGFILLKLANVAQSTFQSI